MLTLHIDLILLISRYISDREKIYWSMSCKKMDSVKYKMIYREKINVERIIQLTYFDNFENVEAIGSINNRPKHAKYVHLCIHGTDIPSFVTHLTFGHYFNK